ncbi:DUF3055 domain-containing protein [Pasteuria penetrans]|uniref:DUF3055 domain-containing protein n=1 Tax=Pasteuria penetrans TaxID=86005 RepID=UPI0011ED5B34|nr:DUF3055 domain-containing protein [Pasteuria penetrans]
MQDPLYDESETVRVRFVGFATEGRRYDLGLIYTHMFFNHPLVICMQTRRSSLLSKDDLENIETIRHIFHLDSLEEAADVASFLSGQLPQTSFVAEVEPRWNHREIESEYPH